MKNKKPTKSKSNFNFDFEIRNIDDILNHAKAAFIESFESSQFINTRENMTNKKEK
jgi:hypothetical protein